MNKRRLEAEAAGKHRGRSIYVITSTSPSYGKVYFLGMNPVSFGTTTRTSDAAFKHYLKSVPTFQAGEADHLIDQLIMNDPDVFDYSPAEALRRLQTAQEQGVIASIPEDDRKIGQLALDLLFQRQGWQERKNA
ncbi:MAG: hypothetical protein ACM3QZ_01740 [Solirubrobacterales bacterium]